MFDKPTLKLKEYINILLKNVEIYGIIIKILEYFLCNNEIFKEDKL